MEDKKDLIEKLNPTGENLEKFFGEEGLEDTFTTLDEEEVEELLN